MNLKELRKVESILKGLLHNSIISSVNFVSRKCKMLGNTPQEPDFIASLAIKFTPELFNILKAVFPKSKFTVTGIYCHQKPLVDIGLPKNPEIGDVLFVYVYTDNWGSRLFNSLLLQAKISQKQSVTISKADEHQLKLYCEWPKFKYRRAGRLNGVVRDILPKTINDGGQYLMIDNHPIYGLSGLPGTFPMGCATPSRTINLNNNLATELVDFFKFKSGRMFEEIPSITEDDWTKMIWDILDLTKSIASKRRNVGLANFPRQSTEGFDGCCYFMSESNSIFGDLHNELGNGDTENNGYIFEEENRSLSVILIECSDQNGQ